MNITKPCSVIINFKTPCKGFAVRGSNGKTYYARYFEKPTLSSRFNMTDKGSFKIIPCGNIDFNLSYSELMPYKEISLPPMQWDKRGKVTIRLNKELKGSPARINTRTRVIEVNERFMKMPVFCQRFILEHEKAHLMYSSEFYCDLYAYNACMKRGGNQSQQLFTLMIVLKRSPFNVDRLKNIIGATKS